MLYPDDLAEKQLFYNETEAEQIARIENTILNFASLKERLIAKGMSRNLAILLHGAPGKRKTETVYQLAKKTGRSIYFVSISSLKSKWFGESEKKIKQLFEDYRTEVKNSKLEPILLFNEADAVLSKRVSNSSSPVAQTENAIQNIILQEMENLEGIMIATSNLTQNLDAAFERRFLFKVKFQTPDLEIKSQIWKSKITSITADEATKLAAKYQLTGAQIDNISKKIAMEEVLNGTEESIEIIEKYCREERLDEFKNIGFK